MTSYQSYGVKLTKRQLEKLGRAVKSNSAITIRLDKNQLSGDHELMLTKTQINKLKKAKSNGTGADIKISKTQIRKAVKEGGALWSGLMAKAVPAIMNLAPKIAAPLATGAVSALGSLGIDKIFGKGIDIPFDFLPKLAAIEKELTKMQKGLINKAYQSGKGLNFKPTQKQIRGGLLGTLAAIGIPMAIELASKLFGKGLSVPGSKPKGKGLRVGPKPVLMPYNPPPFFGTWENPTGMGVKKKMTQGQGLLLGKNSPFNSVPILGAIF